MLLRRVHTPLGIAVDDTVGARIKEILCQEREAEIVKNNRKLGVRKTAQTGQRKRNRPIYVRNSRDCRPPNVRSEVTPTRDME